MITHDGDVMNPTLVSAEGVSKYNEPLLSVDNLDYKSAEARRRKRSNFTAVACCACCCLFLILFFFIPRQPQIEGVDSMEGLITNQNASNPSFVIEAVYSVYNANPYKIKIDSLDTTVTIQTTASTPSTPVYVITGNGVWPPNESSVEISSSSWGTVPIWYYFNGNDSSRRVAVMANIEQCCSSYSVVRTSGEIDVKSWLSNYDMPVNNLVTNVYCDCT